MTAAAPILPPSEQEFRQRVRDLEAAAHANALALEAMESKLRTADYDIDVAFAENARLRRALVRLAKLQPERQRRAMMEVINDG